jgi:hypothetical protein
MKSSYGKNAAGLLACGVLACGVLVSVPVLTPPARAADPAKSPTPGISAEATTAIQQMGKTLSANEFSFQAQTIRAYQDNDGQPLHIFHTMKVVVHRPDRLAVHRTGDDGASDLLYDGKTVAIFGASANKYVQVAAPTDIDATLDEVADGLGVDFPLADFVDADPGKSFLSDVTSGREVNTVTIDGKPYRHLFFSQAGGIDLEIWLAKTEQAVPRRLVVTYRLMPGQPQFVAEFSDWNFSAHPADAAFVFQPPAGATKVELQAVAPEKGRNG